MRSATHSATSTRPSSARATRSAFARCATQAAATRDATSSSDPAANRPASCRCVTATHGPCGDAATTPTPTKTSPGHSLAPSAAARWPRTVRTRAPSPSSVMAALRPFRAAPPSSRAASSSSDSALSASAAGAARTSWRTAKDKPLPPVEAVRPRSRRDGRACDTLPKSFCSAVDDCDTPAACASTHSASPASFSAALPAAQGPKTSSRLAGVIHLFLLWSETSTKRSSVWTART
mmetsp:Transcript_5318/g.18914  ORF Transcript_5318/g.18914 Transcript_5318/m.18914 type:complete len:235 (+) Transcript_5318:280-984(+)